METHTIECPATGGLTFKIEGKPSGPFLVHKNFNSIFVEGDDVPAWSVSHLATGARFPWSFLTEEAATAFADDVLPLMDWANVKTARKDDKMDVKLAWAAGAPTKEQTATVWQAAKSRGGFRCANNGRNERG